MTILDSGLLFWATLYYSTPGNFISVFEWLKRESFNIKLFSLRMVSLVS